MTSPANARPEQRAADRPNDVFVRELVAVTRREQGLPDHVEDPGTLGRVAAVITAHLHGQELRPTG